MFKIHIRRNLRVRTSLKILNYINNDWTHFPHLHRKTIADHRLLYKEGKREIFYYKSRCLYPLPIFEHYLVFRDYPTDHSYRNIYINIRTGQAHLLNSAVYSEGEVMLNVSDYLFSVPSYWRLFPKLFLWVFKKRMRRVLDEDNEWNMELNKAENLVDNSTCAPAVPESFDPFDHLFKDKKLMAAESHVSFEFDDAVLFENQQHV